MVRKALSIHIATGLLAAATLTACGGDGGAALETDGELSVIRASVVPSIDAASLYLAEEQGFLEEEGLKLEVSDAGSGPASVAAVMGGSADIGLAANVALVQARTNDVPLVAVAPAAGTGDDPEVSKDQVVVAEDSDIKSYADLAGHTVAVVAVKNSPELFVRYLVDEDGGDSGSIEFVEIAFPEMSSALESGRVDAIAINEPFLSGAVAKGGRPLGSYIDEVLGTDTAYTYWFTNEKLANTSSEQLEALARALAKAGQYADENPDAVRAVVTDQLGIDAETAANINLPKFGNPADPETFGTMAELMVDYGFIESAPNTDDIVDTQ